MSEIYNIDFEAGNFSELDNDSSGAQLFVSSTGAISGTYSCNHEWKSAPNHAVSNNTNLGAGVTVIRTGCKIKIGATFSFGTLQTSVSFFSHVNGSTLYGFRLDKSGSEVRPTLTGSSVLTTTVNINDGATHTLEARIVKGSGGGSGIHAIYIDGVLAAEDTNVNNEALFDDARIGVLNWILSSLQIGGGTGHAGGVITDDWILRDDNTQIYPPTTAATDEFTAAPMKKPCDIDADGANIFIAALNSLGFPTLIQFTTALNANGSVVFEPGAGTDIGVGTGRFDADTIWIAGKFNITNVVEKSENGGTSFSVKDPGTFGAIGAFKVGPDSDDRVLVFDSDNGDLRETIDSGNNWTAINTSVTPVIKAIGRLGQNVQEAVFGNASAASNNIDYSINSGIDLEDYSGGFPEVDITGVIIN